MLMMTGKVEVYTHFAFLSLLICILIVVFGDSIFVAENFFNKDFHYTLLIVDAQVFGNMFRIWIGGVHTDIEQIKGHGSPQISKTCAMSEVSDHNANLRLILIVAMPLMPMYFSKYSLFLPLSSRQGSFFGLEWEMMEYPTNYFTSSSF